MWRPDPAAARPDLAQLPLLPPRATRIRGAQGRPRRRSAGTLHRRRARGVLPRRRLAGREHGGGWRATVPAAYGGGGSEGYLQLRLGLGLGGLQSATRPIQVPSRPHPHPHRLLRPAQRTKAPQDAKSAPRGRHGAMADAIHAGAVASPWREPEKRHGDMATICRRYSDALTTMILKTLGTLTISQGCKENPRKKTETCSE